LGFGGGADYANDIIPSSVNVLE